MLRVNPDGQNALFIAFAIMEVGGMLVLFVWAFAKQRAYLRRCASKYPFLAHKPFYFPLGSVNFSSDRVLHPLLHQRQAEPELERLRRDMWRSFRYYRIWLFGFPVLVAGVLALLILSGLVTFTR
jgi:hypothetical protein